MEFILTLYIRVYSHSTIKKFWNTHKDARIALEIWLEKMEENKYTTPNEVISNFPGADIIGNGRIVFNIAHNKYRLIGYFRYRFYAVYIRFIGTHTEYENINDIKNI